MSKRLTYDMAYDAPQDAVLAMLADPAFREEVCDYQRVLRKSVTVETTASGGSSAPTPEQQAAMGEAATSTGLTVERFNAIGAAIAAEEHLRARIALAEAELAG